MFVSHLENICLFPSADLRLRLFQHSFVSQTLTNDTNDGGALVEDYRRDARENKFNENERRKKKKETKIRREGWSEEINRCTNSMWRARLVVISS